jgi:glycerophosphoryl diester phosphodiesterase
MRCAAPIFDIRLVFIFMIVCRLNGTIFNQPEFLRRSPLLIAHRGESDSAPENTLAAIELAWSNGSLAVEFDVRLTRDDRLVLCHDPDTLRTAGQKYVIRDHDLHELQHLDVGQWKGPQWAGQRLPTLEQVLETLPPGRCVFIEIKDGPETIAPLIKAVKSFCPSRCRIIAFDPEVIAALKRSSPGMEAYWLVSRQYNRHTNQWEPSAAQLLTQARAIQADGLDLEASQVRQNGQNILPTQAVDASLVAALHDAGLKVYVWTIDDPHHAKLLQQAGVDGITTNRPAWMAPQLEQIADHPHCTIAPDDRKYDLK